MKSFVIASATVSTISATDELAMSSGVYVQVIVR